MANETGQKARGDVVAEVSPYITLSRAQWAKLRADTPMPLSEAELEHFSGVIEQVSMTEVQDIYLPKRFSARG